jgi:hypothetical protein
MEVRSEELGNPRSGVRADAMHTRAELALGRRMDRERYRMRGLPASPSGGLHVAAPDVYGSGNARRPKSPAPNPTGQGDWNIIAARRPRATPTPAVP